MPEWEALKWDMCRRVQLIQRTVGNDVGLLRQATSVHEVTNVMRLILRHPLNQGGKVSALGRFVRWQLASRILGFPMVVPFVGTSRLVLARGMSGGTGNFYTGLHEFEEMSFVLDLLRPGDLFVDVGANIGSYTVLAAGVTRAKTIAFEPVPKTFEILLDNVGLNRISHLCTCHNVAVGSERGTVRFTDALDCENHVCEGSFEGRSIEVKVATLDEMLADNEPLLLKIDVEGYEPAVLEGAVRTLARKSLLAVIVEMNLSTRKYNFSDTAVHERLVSNGFRPNSWRPFDRTFSAIDGLPQQSGNVIYVRDLTAVRQRVESAPRVTVNGTSL